MNTCRFCHRWIPSRGNAGVKYGVRHYAHWGCFLTEKGVEGLKALPDWQRGQVPVMVAKDVLKVTFDELYAANVASEQRRAA